jgi:hypothetical protein
MKAIRPKKRLEQKVKERPKKPCDEAKGKEGERANRRSRELALREVMAIKEQENNREAHRLVMRSSARAEVSLLMPQYSEKEGKRVRRGSTSESSLRKVIALEKEQKAKGAQRVRRRLDIKLAVGRITDRIIKRKKE